MYIILIGMSPWVSIPCTLIPLDWYSRFLYYGFWLRMEKNVENRKWQYAVVIGLLTATGYRIKPQIVIITIAICIIFSLGNIFEKYEGFSKNYGQPDSGNACCTAYYIDLHFNNRYNDRFRQYLWNDTFFNDGIKLF